MREQDLITQAQAATILGRSVSAISRAVKAGRLEYVDLKRRLFSRPGLEVRYANHTRRRVDQPMVKMQKAPTGDPPGAAPERTIPETYWERLDQKLQWVFEGAPAYWQEPPNPQRLRLFVRSLDELRSQVEAEGLELEQKNS